MTSTPGAETPSSVAAPTPIHGRRSIAPDLARGIMLVLIAVGVYGLLIGPPDTDTPPAPAPSESTPSTDPSAPAPRATAAPAPGIPQQGATESVAPSTGNAGPADTPAPDQDAVTSCRQQVR